MRCIKVGERRLAVLSARFSANCAETLAVSALATGAHVEALFAEEPNSSACECLRRRAPPAGGLGSEAASFGAVVGDNDRKELEQCAVGALLSGKTIAEP